MHTPTLSRWRIVCIALLAATALSGCSSKKKPAEPLPAKLDLATVVAPDVNPDVDGRPSPLLVRVYALRAKDGFSSADFFALFERDEQVLAGDLAKREEFILQPGQTQTLPREYAPDITHIGVMAAYRDVERSTWRGLIALPPGADGVLAISAGANAIALSLEASGKAKKKD